MAGVRILGDSCCDLTTELRRLHGIEYVKMRVCINGTEKPASLDWDYFSPSEFYGYMRKGIRVTTVQVSTEEYRAAFGDAARAGEDVVYIGCSSALSGSVNVGAVIAEEVMKAFPERKILVVDALNSCMGQGILLLRAAELRDAGKTATEIAEDICRVRETVNQVSTVDSLDALCRAGRVKAGKAFLGNMFGVKPIIISDAKGQNVPVKKVKGRRASLEAVAAMMAEVITNPESQTVYVGHADCMEDARALADRVKQLTGCRDTFIFDVGPIVGASVGPTMIVLYAFGQQVTYIG